MADVCAKAKDETENLYIANKKLWEQNKNTRIGLFLGHNEEKTNLHKENPIIGKRKHQMLRRKLAIGRTSILSSPKSCPNAAKAGHCEKRRLRLKRYNTKSY